MGRYTEGSVGRDIFAGAVAGIAAIWVADKLDQAIYRAGGPAAIRKTEAARPGGMDPAHVLAKRAADAIGADIGNAKDNAAGHTIHYGIAAGMGALYGLLRGLSPSVSTGRGALFGIAMFVLEDEVGNTLMGTSGNPFSYPIRDHARGAAAHTLFGVMTDLGTRLIAPWRDQVVIEQGPPLSERWDRGRDYLVQGRDNLYEQGRGYLGQGRAYASQLANEARARLPELADTARRARSQLPDYDDAASLAHAGRKRANRFADDVRSRLPGIDPAQAANAARRQARNLANDARSYAQESGLSRALKRLLG